MKSSLSVRSTESSQFVRCGSSQFVYSKKCSQFVHSRKSTLFFPPSHDHAQFLIPSAYPREVVHLIIVWSSRGGYSPRYRVTQFTPALHHEVPCYTRVAALRHQVSRKVLSLIFTLNSTRSIILPRDFLTRNAVRRAAGLGFHDSVINLDIERKHWKIIIKYRHSYNFFEYCIIKKNLFRYKNIWIKYSKNNNKILYFRYNAI